MWKPLLLFLFSATFIGAAEYVPDELIFATDSNADISEIVADIKNFINNSSEVKEFTTSTYLVRLKAGTMKKAYAVLSKNPKVKYVQPNYIKRALE